MRFKLWTEESYCTPTDVKCSFQSQQNVRINRSENPILPRIEDSGHVKTGRYGRAHDCSQIFTFFQAMREQAESGE